MHLSEILLRLNNLKSINMKITYKFSFIMLLFLFVFASCQKEYEQKLGNAYPIAGEWVLQAEYGGAVDAGPYHINIYNVANGTDSVWIQDKDFWKYQIKASYSSNSLSFKADSAVDILQGDKVTIKNAKVINTDSIQFEAEFKSDPGNTYKFAGHRRIGYDEYTK